MGSEGWAPTIEAMHTGTPSGTNRVVLGRGPRGQLAADGRSEDEKIADVAEEESMGESK
jgi:hypothetical protein